MQTKAATALYDYWARQRGERAVPLRSAIEPADIAAILPDVFILEDGRLHAPRFRLAGTRLCAQFARELKGSDFDALFAPDQRVRVARIAENVMAQAAPAIMHVQLVDGTLETTEAEIALLPLATRGRTADRIIGTFAPLPGQRPPLSAFRYATLGALSVIDPERRSDPAANRPSIPMPTSIMAMRPAGLGQTVSRVMHLRIFEGGRKAGEPQER
ncbi:PAS domain-containing protein [Shinella sp. NM-101]|uniref:PAS domain-containing protein n=1 Tax=Shinella sp. NM-101 TaxID=2744455 RepID=UPI001F296F80|nr:PAS domain-containing protein [Shinella sp. NM-101]